ncbi:SusC/RagA family TonB-linked outer membrane protein [Pedobacter steynii]|uniref:Secretin/TonB short N-terminal domain-containing protein n=1 Tax=Pedobacter steynii TaxID=430522 RepID=A0A1D7QL01_9SPHI|nr:SusC/RagA family TonB-linked outer membrane protein [Pedobacter steynii]AOM79354.1 hypothetical protein BFS30_20580 [Pedobacter steynii]
MSKSNASLTELFKEIRKQTGYDFVLPSDLLKQSKPVSLQVKNVELEEVLKICFEAQPFTYELNNKTIIVSEKEKSLFDNLVARFQSIDVRGKIVDSLGNKLIGATVKIKGTNRITKTDTNGEFILTNVDDKAILVITYLGFKERELKAVPNLGRIILTALVGELEGVNVVSTGIVQRNRDSFTGSTRTITNEELKKISATNIFAGISAMDPSFRIIANNATGGNINQIPDIQMRGTNSLPNLTGDLSANPNAPLIILDGFEVSIQRLVDLDINLIERIDLLKDASATALYGSRGANGVLVVTSIAPKPGKVQVTINNDFRFTTPDLSDYNLGLSSFEKLDFEKRAQVYTATDNNANTQYELDQQYNKRYMAAVSGVNTNWLTLPLQNGTSNRTSLYISGGDQVIRYGLQGNTDFQSGVMKGQDRNDIAGQFDLQYLMKKLQFRNSIRIFQNTSNESPYGSFAEYARLNPYWSPYNADGSLFKGSYESLFIQDLPTILNTYGNPLADASLHSVNKNQTFGISNNLSLRYNIIPGLFIESNFSLNKQSGTTDQFFSAEDSQFLTQNDLSRRGSYTARSSKSNSYESITTASYNLSLGRHQIFNNASFNLASNANSFYSVVAEGFPYDRLDNLLFATQYQLNSKPTGDESTTRRLGLLYSGNYSFDNRFLADFTIRRDGSSQYGADRQFGTFWSAGIGWNLHNESFIKSISFVDRLRLRASYGSTGSLNIPAYSAQTRYNFGTNTSYYDELGASINSLGNPLLSWQNVYKTNFGVEATIWKQRIDVRLDVYSEQNRSAISPVSIPSSSGFTKYYENLGYITNNGIEFSARVKVLENRANNLSWNLSVNGFSNHNILSKLSDKFKNINEQIEAANSTENTDQTAPNIQFREGESMQTIYGVRSLGIDPATGHEVFLKLDGTRTLVWDAADKVPLGIAQPKWNGNVNSMFILKGFEVNLVFNYQFGGQLYNQTMADKIENTAPGLNVDRRIYDLGWSTPGQVSHFRTPVLIRAGYITTRTTSRFVQDNNLINLSSASLAYNFRHQPALLRSLGLRSLMVTAITNDVFRTSTIATERGTDNPFARTYSLSLRAGF